MRLEDKEGNYTFDLMNMYLPPATSRYSAGEELEAVMAPGSETDFVCGDMNWRSTATTTTVMWLQLQQVDQPADVGRKERRDHKGMAIATGWPQGENVLMPKGPQDWVTRICWATGKGYPIGKFKASDYNTHTHNNPLRHAVAMAAEASKDPKKMLRKRAAKPRRRTVRIKAITPSLSRHDPAKKGANGKWPTDHGAKLNSLDLVLQALANHVKGKHGADAVGASDPLQLKAKAASVGIAAKIDGRVKGKGIIGKEAWKKVWLATRKGQNRSWRSGGAASGP